LGLDPLLRLLWWLLLAFLQYLHDAVLFFVSLLWPVTQGEVTAVDVERIEQGFERLRLSVAYKFSIGEDGPYTGEFFWMPAFFSHKRVIAARRKIRNRQRVLVRYRTRDPSVNTLDRRTWHNL
jgi:hypothetical protein